MGMGIDTRQYDDIDDFTMTFILGIQEFYGND
jgi:hypothetical protein